MININSIEIQDGDCLLTEVHFHLNDFKFMVLHNGYNNKYHFPDDDWLYNYGSENRLINEAFWFDIENKYKSKADKVLSVLNDYNIAIDRLAENINDLNYECN